MMEINVCSWLLQDEKMCNKAVDNYAHVLEFVRNCYKSQK